jgi:hypothetical protein
VVAAYFVRLLFRPRQVVLCRGETTRGGPSLWGWASGYPTHCNHLTYYEMSQRILVLDSLEHVSNVTCNLQRQERGDDKCKESRPFYLVGNATCTWPDSTTF